jgi:hypothetical protein
MNDLHTRLPISPSLPGSALYTPALPSVQANQRWYNTANEQEFLSLAEGLALACRHKLTIQIQRYTEQIHDLADKDRADLTVALLAQSLHYTSVCAHHQWDLQPNAVVSISWRGAVQSWQLQPLSAYFRGIPLQALQALDKVYTSGIVPNGLWIAEPYRAPTVSHGYRDPLLCASFGRWLVVLADWV